ncbi:MAG: starch-binding protein [Bacteroidaceae bacterium]|nr:starch-binding protein [Bacteroidaceae bacterium]
MKKILLFFCAMFALSAMALTYNVTVPAGTNACYIAGDMNGWSHQEMTKVDDTHYTIDIADANESQGYKYSSGPGWDYVEKDANGGEINNRTYSENDVVAKWNKVYEPSAPVEKPEGDVTIYLERSTAYNVTYLYAWEGADLGNWPGMQMNEIEQINNVEYWKHTFVAPEKAINIIFTDGLGNQTNDITGVTKTTYYRLNRTSGRTDVTVIDPFDTPEIPETPGTLTYNVTVPEGTPMCYIVGAYNGWDIANASLMTKVDDTHYTITLDNVTKASEYKYTCGKSWEYVEQKAGGIDVANRTWSENDVVEAWFDMPSSTPDVIESLTYNVTVPVGTPACYIVGAYNGWNVNTAVQMTRVDDTHFTVTLDEVSKSMEYKYICGQSWDYVELRADRTDVANRTWSENDVVEAWANTANIGDGLTYNVTVPEGTPACYIVGEFNGWDVANALIMTKVNDTQYTITIENATKEMTYKYTCGRDWACKEVISENIDEELMRTWNENDFVWNWECFLTTTLTYRVTVPEGTPACYIVGEFNGWNVEDAVEMNYEHPNTFYVTIENVTKAMGYKYVSARSWDNVECLADGAERANRHWTYANDVVEAWRGTSSEIPGSLTYNVTVPEGTPACYIVGEFNGWDAGNAASMIKVDDTHYTITLDNVTTSSQYKYLNGLSWEYEEDRPDNANRTWSESDVVTAWKAIAEAPQEPEEPETLVYSVTVPAGTPNCYIAGEMSAWTFLPMTQVDDTHYTITLMGVTKSMKYKYTCGEDWAYVEVLIDGSDSVDRRWSENDVVEAWKAIPEDGGVNSTTDNTLSVYGSNGAINIIAAQPTQVAIYNAQGILVVLANANGNTTIELPRGLYIVNGNKVLVY